MRPRLQLMAHRLSASPVPMSCVCVDPMYGQFALLDYALKQGAKAINLQELDAGGFSPYVPEEAVVLDAPASGGGLTFPSGANLDAKGITRFKVAKGDWFEVHAAENIYGIAVAPKEANHGPSSVCVEAFTDAEDIAFVSPGTFAICTTQPIRRMRIKPNAAYVYLLEWKVYNVEFDMSKLPPSRPLRPWTTQPTWRSAQQIKEDADKDAKTKAAAALASATAVAPASAASAAAISAKDMKTAAGPATGNVDVVAQLVGHMDNFHRKTVAIIKAESNKNTAAIAILKDDTNNAAASTIEYLAAINSTLQLQQHK